MGKGKKAKRHDAGTAASAAALGAFLTQPIVKDLLVRSLWAAMTAAARSERVRGLARRVRDRANRS